MRMSISILRGAPLFGALLFAFTTMGAQGLSGESLVASLRSGGHVIVMRHAS